MLRLIVDGYNLLHALGMAPRPGMPSLERARRRMLDWLSGQLDGDRDSVCIVFDSKNGRGGSEQNHRGIHVRFAANETADDLIERMIREEPAPAAMTVVSNDHRIQQAASRRGCRFWDCNRLIDWLQTGNRDRPAKSARGGDKPENPSGPEVEDWLRRFEE